MFFHFETDSLRGSQNTASNKVTKLFYTESAAVPTLETPADSTPSTLTRTVNSNSAVDSAVEIPVAEEIIIWPCVTPRKVNQVREALQKEANRHRCAVTL